MSDIVIVIPTYNEAENLEAITEALLALELEDVSILVVEDASPDGTGEIAERLVTKYPGQFHVIHREGKLGLGTAYITGFCWALEHDAKAIIQMDADFSHSPSYLPQMLSLLADYDVVVGSRYVPGGKVDERWSFGRWLLSWWANSIWVRLILWTKTKDATAGFKCWRAEALHKINMNTVRSNGYVFQVEMCYAAEKAGLRIKEIPIYFEDRRIGKSKMSIPIKFEAALRVFQIRGRKQNTP